jgi:hypothetical protein
LFFYREETISVSNVVYLAGAMEKAGPRGLEWRSKITPHLEKLGYRVWNPYKEELNVGINVTDLMRLKKKDFDSYTYFCHKIVDYDLQHLLRCSIVVTLLDQACQEGAGTYGELTVCRLYGVPVYALIDRENGIKDIPAWAVGCLTKYTEDPEEFYSMLPTAHSAIKMKSNNNMKYIRAWLKAQELEEKLDK